jgi:phosphomannomutase/phosphoglucomutase
MNPQIFREYDVRGNAERDLPDEVARDLGRALGSVMAERGKRRIMVGRDCRALPQRCATPWSRACWRPGGTW